ncbi:MAG TPA: hypothetical protein VFO65_05860, partial [Acidimicrobiales bacterium]|nr:hypothetical protein [Acidimicrobiales bacterium]
MTADPRPQPADCRLVSPWWRPPEHDWRRRMAKLLVLVNGPLAAWYLVWLLSPQRPSHPVLYGMLVAAELFNMIQAVGFWWTVASIRRRPPAEPLAGTPAVDVFIPVCGEPVEMVDTTVVAATRMRSAEVRVWVLDDGGDDGLEAMARRLEVGYLRRPGSDGAKAGN